MELSDACGRKGHGSPTDDYLKLVPSLGLGRDQHLPFLGTVFKRQLGKHFYLLLILPDPPWPALLFKLL